MTRWSLVGPILAKRGQNSWFRLRIDAAASVPRTFVLRQQPVPVRRVTVDGALDFTEQVGELVDVTNFGVRNQVVAFASLQVPEDGTITLTYDADWRAVWWIDGKEVYATRGGNGGKVGAMHHRIVAALSKGRHVVAVRVISSIHGWSLSAHVEDWQPGVAGELRADRGADWRDYTRTLVRLEQEALPTGQCGKVKTEQYEQWMADAGVDARWMSVVDAFEGSVYRSRHLPMRKDTGPECEAHLKAWIRTLHEHRVCAISWYALSLYRPAWEQHPDWRQQYLVLDPRVTYAKATCCINSPYGDAVIAYVIEALKKFKLDGFWFDGAAFSPVWEAAQPVSCCCDYCKAKFKADTGQELPDRYDWSLPQFPRWVQWRYDMFSAYWLRLEEEVHKVVPEATLAFNHYHREGIPWNAAVPLTPFGGNIVSACEAEGEPLKGAFHTRLMRAYDRPDTEVWMGMGGIRKAIAHGRTPVHNYREVLEFVLTCCTAGGHTSFSGLHDYTLDAPIVPELAREIRQREPYIDLPAVPHAALHVSQQTETFVFGRNPDFATDRWVDLYWNSTTGWHHLMAHAGLTCDVVFDAHLKKSRLARYPVLVMPLASALTKRQVDTILSYVRDGGTLITGPWFGVLNAFGQKSEAYPLGDRSSFPMGDQFPEWDELLNRPQLRFVDEKEGAVTANPLHHRACSRKRVNLELSAGNRALKMTRLGQGRIIQLGFDVGSLFRYSESPIVVNAFREFFRRAVRERPRVEIDNSDGVIMGVFQGKKNETIIQVQQVFPPWRQPPVDVTQPAACWGLELKWNGAPPKSVKCCLPEVGPELLVRKTGRAWRFTVPPFVWGQVIKVST